MLGHMETCQVIFHVLELLDEIKQPPWMWSLRISPLDDDAQD